VEDHQHRVQLSGLQRVRAVNWPPSPSPPVPQRRRNPSRPLKLKICPREDALPRALQESAEKDPKPLGVSASYRGLQKRSVYPVITNPRIWDTKKRPAHLHRNRCPGIDLCTPDALPGGPNHRTTLGRRALRDMRRRSGILGPVRR
jgi:hypothetical protein